MTNLKRSNRWKCEVSSWHVMRCNCKLHTNYRYSLMYEAIGMQVYLQRYLVNRVNVSAISCVYQNILKIYQCLMNFDQSIRIRQFLGNQTFLLLFPKNKFRFLNFKFLIHTLDKKKFEQPLNIQTYSTRWYNSLLFSIPEVENPTIEIIPVVVQVTNCLLQ